jgi:hypothetical protein
MACALLQPVDTLWPEHHSARLSAQKQRQRRVILKVESERLYLQTVLLYVLTDSVCSWQTMCAWALLHLLSITTYRYVTCDLRATKSQVSTLPDKHILAVEVTGYNS